MRKKIRFCASALILLFPIILPGITQEGEKIFNQDDLINDCRQLARILESSHPDPYIRGGGRIAFHRRLQDILSSIPAEGMSLPTYYRLLLPFVAAIGDGHTRISLPREDQTLTPGLPMGFCVIDKDLCVSYVFGKNLDHLLGAKLLSVEGVVFSNMLQRQGKIQGYDNEYHRLSLLAASLSTKSGLSLLLPEWKEQRIIRVELRLPSGEVSGYAFTLAKKYTGEAIAPSSQVVLPDTTRLDFAYCFLDAAQKVALLRIDGMFSYRENFEYFNAMGVSWAKDYARRVYQRVLRETPPEDISEVIAALPAATDTFRSLAQDMKAAQTQTLLIDLRRNGGGNSSMSQFLIYFLFGRSAMESQEGGYTIQKYSDLYFSQYSESTLDKLNQERRLALTKDDYDFKYEQDFMSRKKGEKAQADHMEMLRHMPTFLKEFQSEEYSGYYLPKNVVVLVTSETYSSGFDMAAALFKLGAILVGTPSGQAGNSFGDTLFFSLSNTGISGSVSYKQFFLFPDDAEKGQVLLPNHILSYEKWATYNFDPNAEVLFALEHITNNQRPQ